jgi:DNA-binding beta-propeller fold protein YncE
VLQVDAADGHIEHEADIGARVRALLASRGSLWATLDGGTVAQLELDGLAVRMRLRVTGSPEAVTTSPGSVFVTDDQAREVVRVRTRTGKIAAQVGIGATGAGPPSQITVYDGSIWVYEGSSVLRLLLGTTRLVDRISLAGGGGSIAAGAGGVWVSGSFGVERIDAATGQVTKPVDVGAAGAAIATTGDAVWVVQREGGTLLRLSP